MRILLTRPRDDSEAFAARLAEHGVGSLIAPLMEVVYSDGPEPDLADVQGLILTSANGVRALARRTGERGIAVFAVGDATARTARDAGFANIASASGDVDDLAALIGERCEPSAGPLLHVAGSAVAGDLSGALTARGFDCRREVFYKVESPDELPGDIAEALDSGSVDGVALFSPRSAAILERLVAGAGRTGELASLDAFALSANVAAALDETAWRSVETAARPTAGDLLEVVLAAARTR